MENMDHMFPTKMGKLMLNYMVKKILKIIH